MMNTRIPGIQQPHVQRGATDINIVNNGGERSQQVAAPVYGAVVKNGAIGCRIVSTMCCANLAQ